MVPFFFPHTCAYAQDVRWFFTKLTILKTSWQTKNILWDGDFSLPIRFFFLINNLIFLHLFVVCWILVWREILSKFKNNYQNNFFTLHAYYFSGNVFPIKKGFLKGFLGEFYWIHWLVVLGKFQRLKLW